MNRCPPIGTLVIAHRPHERFRNLRLVPPMIGRVVEVKRLFPEIPSSQASVTVSVGEATHVFGADEVWPACQPRDERTLSPVPRNWLQPHVAVRR